MASLVDFIDRVRTLQDLPPHGVLALTGTEPDNEDACALATALGCRVTSVGGDDGGGPEWLHAMRFDDRLLPRRIGVVLGLDWRADPPAVRLPDAVADVAVSQHMGKVEADDVGLLRGWWVPLGTRAMEDGRISRHTTKTCSRTPNGSFLRPADGGRASDAGAHRSRCR